MKIQIKIFSQLSKYVKKKIGPARVEDNRSLFYRKDISLLARNGFNFETSKKVMDLSKNDYNKIVKLLDFFLFLPQLNFYFISHVIFYKNKHQQSKYRN